MIQREDVAHLFKDFRLLGIEVDQRHIDMFNYMYALGMEAGKAKAIASVEWRINGPLWAKFIKEELCP
jgi:hypothetical protein